MRHNASKLHDWSTSLCESVDNLASQLLQVLQVALSLVAISILEDVGHEVSLLLRQRNV